MPGLKVIQEPVSTKEPQKITAIIAVAAGKGGVGKSTVSVNLALALRERGYRVGLLDADVYGPSLEQMLPEGMEPANHPEDDERLLPALTFGMPFISVAHFKKDASIVRAPIANQIIDQFLNTVDWGELDYLIVDFPPGTGDIQLTLMQKAPIAGALMVTTPQSVATLDVRKAMQLFQNMHIPLIGVVENMSYLEGSQRFFPFGQGGGEALAKEFQIPFIGQIPLDPLLSELCDDGRSLFKQDKAKEIKDVFLEIADQLMERLRGFPSERVEVRQGSTHHLEFFIDNRWRALPLQAIQSRCPCVRCEREKKSEKDVGLLEFSLVGRYAIKVKFTSGCSQGVYPFSLIKSILRI